MAYIRNWHVLIVEDETDGQEVVNEILGYFNAATSIAATAEEAIELLGQEQFTAAVIDLGLPGIDGLELMRYIRDQPAVANLPCIAITAYHTTQLKKEALEAGFDAYFPKPLDETSFLRELDRVITQA